jgi:hypothetical protein
MSSLVTRGALIAVLTIGGAHLANSEELTIDWWTVDGGGEMWGYGDEFELSGTIGQPDAGVMTGGDFELIGGFWPALGAPTVCPGDLNCDGQIDFGDINPFVIYLSNYGAWLTEFPGCNPLNGDIDGNGTYGQGSFGDINPFVALFSSGAPPYPCP